MKWVAFLVAMAVGSEAWAQEKPTYAQLEAEVARLKAEIAELRKLAVPTTQPARPAIADYEALVARERERLIAVNERHILNLRDEHRNIRAGRTRVSNKPARLKAIDDEIHAKELAIRNLKAGTTTVRVRLADAGDLKVGMIGCVDSIRVSQRISDSEAIARVGVMFETGMAPNGARMMDERRHEVWIQGVDLTGVVDDQFIKDQKYVFVVAGTKTFATATGGSRTVFLLDAIN